MEATPEGGPAAREEAADAVPKVAASPPGAEGHS